MNNREYKAIIEAILFTWAEPLHINEIMKVLDLDKRTTRELIKELQQEFDHHRRGLVLNELDDHFQLSTRPEHFDHLSKLVKQSKRRISNSAMEVLAIIAYKQPITRVEIDNIRGVKSYSSVDTLKERKLIQEVGKADAVGKPILYGTTVDFLSAFNLNSLDDLPTVEAITSLDSILEEINDEN